MPCHLPDYVPAVTISVYHTLHCTHFCSGDTSSTVKLSVTAMTAYSPAMLALHEMLKSQLELTKEFVGMQKRFQMDAADSIKPKYHYTTLQDTKNVRLYKHNLLSL